MMMPTDFAAIAPPLAALAAGLVSAALYGRKRQWLNAVLAGVAGAALAFAIADLRQPAAANDALAIDTGSAGQISDADRLEIPRATAIAALCAILAACGGGGGDESPPEARACPATEPPAVVVGPAACSRGGMS